jgi:uncharacterized protein (TIGR02145 family)
MLCRFFPTKLLVLTCLFFSCNDDPTSVKNTVPKASFMVSPASGNSSTTFLFDASGSTDSEDPISMLEVRWDWENDGSWDTEYSVIKAAVHQYSTEGNITISLEVKDSEGLTDSTTNQISVLDSIITDVDGNTYKTVKIGNQWWMAENLIVTHYNNGDAIPNVSDEQEWYSLSEGAYCNYLNDENNVATYGRLYNWYALNDSRNIAPTGWHVASDDEWKTLERYLGMSGADANAIGWRGTDEASKLKESGTIHWQISNTGTNASGFSALPGGQRIGAYDWMEESFNRMGSNAFFWTSTEGNSSVAFERHMVSHSSQVARYSFNKHSGYSVRCVRD